MGLGLKAQRKLIGDFAASRCGEVLARFTKVERGRKEDRPELAKTILRAKVSGTALVNAKLDWLSRNAAFRLALRDSRGRFVAGDMLGGECRSLARQTSRPGNLHALPGQPR